MSAVFISYRRGDSEGQARALSIELEELLGKECVFMDVDSIALGRDFRQVLQESLQACDVMLALIGPNWLEAKDSAGNRRLESAGDFVRQEIASALKRNIAVTPVLLQGASMPTPDRLPDDLKDLAFRNGFELSHTRWVSDVKELFKRLGLMAQTRTFVPSGGTPPVSPFDPRYAAAGAAARRPAATGPGIATTAGTSVANGANAGNAAAAIAHADDSSKSGGQAKKGLSKAMIAAGAVVLVGVLGVVGYIAMQKKTTDDVVPAIPVPEVLKMPRVEAEAKIEAANLKAVVVKEWNPGAEEHSVIEAEPAPGTKLNAGDTVTLHVSAPGGWVYFGQQGGLEAGETVPMAKAMFLHADQNSSSKELGSVEEGKSVRVLEVGSYGWAKVVVTD
jgi:hypothetical protein